MKWQETTDRLNAIVDRMLGDKIEPRVIPRMGRPFEIDKPNSHDSKSDFLTEKNAVAELIGHADGLIKIISLAYFPKEKIEAAHRMAGRLTREIDKRSVRNHGFDPSKGTMSFLCKSIVENGFSLGIIFLLIELKRSLQARMRELDNQEVEFWSGHSRPPNHYARTMALRLARFYAVETSCPPTYGTSSDGGHPSTDFCRALEEVFLFLGIKADVKNAAKWAIGELRPEDFEKPLLGLGSLFGGFPKPDEEDALAGYMAQPPEKAPK